MDADFQNHADKEASLAEGFKGGKANKGVKEYGGESEGETGGSEGPHPGQSEAYPVRPVLFRYSSQLPVAACQISIIIKTVLKTSRPICTLCSSP